MTHLIVLKTISIY